MEANGEGPDTSSIPSISSLRSRFETLGKEHSPRPPVIPKKSAALAFTNHDTNDDRPKTSSGEGSSHAGMNGGAAEKASPNVRGRPAFPKPRPQSMMSTGSSQMSPPILTVDGPASPPKTLSLDLRQLPSRSLTPSIGSESPRTHSQAVSRTATPALEARMAAFKQTPGSKPELEPTKLPSSAAESPSGSLPPPVNRAAKPKVPVKPTINLKSSSLAAPEIAAEQSDRSASPFSTPPSSGANSPTHPPLEPKRRVRNDSDASFVERLRSDSGASSSMPVSARHRGDSGASWKNRRSRGDSTASFVESSSFPESTFQPPPQHHSAVAKLYRQQNGRAQSTANGDRLSRVSRGQEPSARDASQDKPRLPARPELQTRAGRTSPPKSQSGRTSPTKGRNVRQQRSVDGMTTKTGRIPATHAPSRSALTQGFDRKIMDSTESASAVTSESTPTTLTAPAVPPPRRSMEKRRPEPAQIPPIAPHNPMASKDEEQSTIMPYGDHPPGPSDYPDSSQANRRPPRYPRRPYHIPVGYDTKLLAVCGEFVCTSGFLTKVWNVKSGEQILNMFHDEHIKVSSVVFKPASNPDDEGQRLWLGTNSGDIYEVDIPRRTIVKSRPNAHGRREVVRMFRHASELWTLDDAGDLNVWKADQKGMPSLDSRVHTFKVSKAVSCAVKCGQHLWLASGKEIRVYKPSASIDSDFHVLRQPLSQPGTGDITCGATLSSRPDIVYFGHSDGKVSMYNRQTYSCIGVMNASVYKIIAMAGVGEDLWLGYSTGMMYVLDTLSKPWRVKKVWQAHEKQVCSIVADSSAMWKLDRLQVVTLGTDNMIRVWDGLLEEDWLESRMIEHDTEYCSFRELTAAVLTWNAGASKPHYLQHSIDDSGFLQDYMRSFQPAPDIFVFGFQELVDLEDKKQTAKSFFKSKKKDTNELEHMTHQYRAWRDHLTKCLDDYMPINETYNLLHSASMVGLFTCVFAKSSIRGRIRHIHAAEVKRGMGGRHGNKGALIVRMVLDDSSICFLNCHLAAGQTQTLNRNNDIAAILESECLPTYPLSQTSVARHNDVFASGGDGSMILDHEICILNGDLNYRIDTMGRDTVVKMVESNNLSRLLERDQLLLSKKKNPGFRLRGFEENPITFAPTYKYNVRTDEYDTSEKRRAPAWCDRILYRGIGKVKLDAYRRWELRVSDHRPVSGQIRMRVKTVDETRRGQVWERCRQEFASVRAKVANEVQLDYLTNVLGLSRQEAASALNQ